METPLSEKDEYTRIAAVYDLFLEPLNEGLRGLALKIYPPSKEMRVLDVCCGTGVHLEMYLQRECRVFGIDGSPSMLQRAQRRLGRRAELQLADARAMPYADGSFDLVLCTLALHEMEPEDRKTVLTEMARVMKDDGRMLVTDFHPGPFQFPKGWLTYGVLFVVERLAGARHFRNFRKYIKSGGLRPIIEGMGFTTVKKKIVGGGTFALMLMAKQRQPRINANERERI